MPFNTNASVWRSELKYLPKFMRDFHAQKDLFKTVHECVNVEGHDYAKEVSWITGHCYVIDIFLWFMARHGYTLQKTKPTKGVEFDDIHETLGAAYKERQEFYAKGIREMLDQRNKT